MMSYILLFLIPKRYDRESTMFIHWRDNEQNKISSELVVPAAGAVIYASY